MNWRAIIRCTGALVLALASAAAAREGPVVFLPADAPPSPQPPIAWRYPSPSADGSRPLRARLCDYEAASKALLGDVKTGAPPAHPLARPLAKEREARLAELAAGLAEAGADGDAAERALRSELGAPDGLTLLRGLLLRPERTVHLRSLRVATELGPREPLLYTWVLADTRHADPAVVRAAVTFLAATVCDVPGRALLDVLGHADASIRVLAASHLAELARVTGDARLVGGLATALEKEPHRTVRVFLARAVGNLAHAGAIGAVETLLGAQQGALPDVALRGELTLALARMAPHRAREAARAGLRSPEPFIRARSAVALAEVDSERPAALAGALAQLLDDDAACAIPLRAVEGAPSVAPCRTVGAEAAAALAWALFDPALGAATDASSRRSALEAWRRAHPSSQERP